MYYIFSTITGIGRAADNDSLIIGREMYKEDVIYVYSMRIISHCNTIYHSNRQDTMDKLFGRRAASCFMPLDVSCFGMMILLRLLFCCSSSRILLTSWIVEGIFIIVVCNGYDFVALWLGVSQLERTVAKCCTYVVRKARRSVTRHGRTTGRSFQLLHSTSASVTPSHCLHAFRLSFIDTALAPT